MKHPEYSHTVIFVGGTVIIAALVGMVIYYTAHSSNTVARSKPRSTPTAHDATDTDSWETLRDTHLKFSLKYPQESYPFVSRGSTDPEAEENDWRLGLFDTTKEENVTRLKETSQLLISVHVYEHDIDYYKTVDYPRFFESGVPRELRRDGVKGYLVDYIGPGPLYSSNALFVHDGHVYQFSLATENPAAFKRDILLFNRILSTIHFFE